MLILLVTMHVVVCIALTMILLLQVEKKTKMGIALDGCGSRTFFISTSISNVLNKATTLAAVVFIIIHSLGLMYIFQP